MSRRIKRMTLRELGTTTLLGVVVVWFGFLVVGIFHKEQIARLTVAQTRAELAALDARKMALSGTVHDLGTERGKEASLRATFGVAKPGEDVIIVVPKKELPPPPPETFWQKLKGVFGL